MDLLKEMFGLVLLMFGLFIIGCGYARQWSNFRNRNHPNKPWSSPGSVCWADFCLGRINNIVD